MYIEVHLIGFGENRPPNFNHGNRFRWPVNEPVTPRQLMEKAGFPNPAGLIFMNGDTVIPEDRWSEPLIVNGDRVTLMSAIEGG